MLSEPPAARARWEKSENNNKHHKIKKKIGKLQIKVTGFEV